MKLVLERVGRIFTWEWAVKDISAEFKSGDCVCILGANGSGKSTLLQLICGSRRPTRGAIRIDGRRLRTGSIRERKSVMLVHPDQEMISKRIASHLGTAITLYGRDVDGVEDEAEYWLGEFGLLHKSVTNDNVQFSRGEKTKLWLSTLFTVRPPIWLLDEPHQSGLDARGVELLEKQIRCHTQDGGIVIFTSQWPPHARRLADKLLLLERGNLAFGGPIGALSDTFYTRDPKVAAILRLLENDSVEI